MKKLLSLTVVAALTALAACEREKPDLTQPSSLQTAETSGVAEAVDAYIQSPTDANAAAADRAFAGLDREIAELEQRVAEASGEAQSEARAKLTDLQAFRTRQAARMTEARAKAGASSVGEAVRDAGQAVGEAVGDAADAVRDSVRQ